MMREFMHSMRHKKKIESILDACGFAGQRFVNQSQFISAMLMPSEEPLSGCIGRQYSPPPEHDYPMLILATDVRIVSFVSNTDVDNDRSTQRLHHPYNLVGQIRFYDSNSGDGEFQIRYKGNRRVVVYKDIVSALSPMMEEVSQLPFDIEVKTESVPIEEIFSKKERILHWSLRRRRTVSRLATSPILTMFLNMLLAVAVITQAVAQITR